MKLSVLLLTFAAACACAAPFELKEGDRVLLLGDALLERENTYGLLETRMHQQFPHVKFTVRNLSWSGETPKGWSRASFDNPEKGWERLKEQIAEVKPTVAILGFGMAASLQEMTDRSGDQTLNPDPVRYGAEPMSAGRFKKELGELMDAINERTPDKKPARFVLLSPIKHEDLRNVRPGMPDPAPHNALLEKYSSAIKELAGERQATFLNLAEKLNYLVKRMTDNGISLSPQGYQRLSLEVEISLGWEDSGKSTPKDPAKEAAIQAAILKKNDLFFHQFRPANSTYLFGFRKHEQGKNAVEMPKFTPLIEAVDAEIDTIKRKSAGTTPAPKPDGKPSQKPVAGDPSPENKNDGSLPIPNFSVADGFELTLWADTHLVGKPVGMNWDAAGRLWVACSPVYPQIEPGAHPHDKVVVLEDSDHDGKADKSTTFASNLLIAAGVAPDFSSNYARKSVENSALHTITAAYVGSSTELVRAEDINGDGIADKRRVVLSGFGTEDTHHTIHTLRWGPDGKLYFNQSIYIHSHMETPWGIVRLNSGGICAYDPRTERVEVFARGFINTWGHAWDKWGQSFATDGAGFEGVHWIIPGAMYRTYEGARRILPSISPGTYPKYCGLELIRSPLFPEDWQGNAITCDFRAHKITRFQINDLSQPTEPGKEALSGYVTKELPNPVVTSDASFRPIDVKLGPDGALYIADWTNPIINHGEVDFRDPRRDHTNGRIWRLAPKGKALKWETQIGKSATELYVAVAKERSSESREVALPGGASPKTRNEPANGWQIDAARRVLLSRPDQLKAEMTAVGSSGIGSDPAMFSTGIEFALATGEFAVPENAPPAAELAPFASMEKVMGFSAGALLTRLYGEVVHRIALSNSGKEKDAKASGIALLGTLAKSKAPRIRVEAMRALARVPTAEGAALILEAALNVPGGAAKSTKSEDKGTNQFNQPTFSDTADPYYGYAAWLSINDLDDVFLKALTDGTWKPDTAAKQQQLAWALGALRPEKAGKGLSDFIAKNGLPKDGSGPWIELIGQAGGPKELRLLLEGLLAGSAPDPEGVRSLLDSKIAFTQTDANHRAAAALVAAGRRGVRPESPLGGNNYGGRDFFNLAPGEAKADVLRLAGLWKQDYPEAMVAVISAKGDAVQVNAAFEGLRTLGTERAAKFLTAYFQPELAKEIGDPALERSVAGANAAIRARALGSLAAFRPDVSLAFLRPVLKETDSKAQLALWRELFSSEPFIKVIVAKLPDLTKEQAAPALRAARELGKRGEKLVAAFTPLAGEAPAAPIPQDVTALVDMTKKNGNPAEGELIYRRAALTCTVCHAIGGAGGKVGPDLGTIGASAPLDYIIESTVNPAVKVKEGFHAIAASLKDGRTLSGTIAKETDRDLILRDMTGAEQSVEKASIKERTNIGSLMPAGLIAPLNDREKANLFAFMSQLGKPGPFDASKSNIARTWRVYSGEFVEQVVANKADPAKGIAVYSLVDGRVTKELLEIPLAVAGSSPTIVAAAKFNTVSAVKSRLHLAGITKAWLDGAPLAIASDPNPVVDLAAGDHTLVIKLDTAAIPAHFRAEVPEARFLTE